MKRIALLMSAPTESATAASEVLSAALQNAECLDDAKESTLDKGEAIQYVLDNPSPVLKRLRRHPDHGGWCCKAGAELH